MNPANARRKEHVIEDISFRKNYIVCRCSFRGTIAEYDAHRRAHRRPGSHK